MTSTTKLLIEGAAIPILSLVGIVGNTASVLVLRSHSLDMKVTFRQILMMLAVFDTILVVCMLFSFSLPLISLKWKEEIHPKLFPWLLPFIQISLNGSIWSTVAVAVERGVSVTRPQGGRTLGHSSLLYVLPVVVGTFLWNITRFLELRTCHKLVSNGSEVSNLTFCLPTDPDDRLYTDFSTSEMIDRPVQSNTNRMLGELLQYNDSAMMDKSVQYNKVQYIRSGVTEDISTLTENISTVNTSTLTENFSTYLCHLSICPTEMRKDMSYCRDYILIANFLVMVLMPFITITLVNTKLYRFITNAERNLGNKTNSSSRQKRDIRIARILIAIVIVFSVCNVPRVILNLYEVTHLALQGDIRIPWPDWCEFLTQISHLLLVFNSSTNFVIYCCKDRKFRKVFLTKFGLRDGARLNVVDWENVSARTSNTNMDITVIYRLKEQKRKISELFIPVFEETLTSSPKTEDATVRKKCVLETEGRTQFVPKSKGIKERNEDNPKTNGIHQSDGISLQIQGIQEENECVHKTNVTQETNEDALETNFVQKTN